MKLGALSIRFLGHKLLRSAILSALLFGLLFMFGAASWGAVAIKAEPVVTGLSSPVDITHAGDGSGRLFIVLQGGSIVIFDGVQILSPPFLDITSLVSSGGERGLLGAAFHPNYVGNGFFYVSYTDLGGGSVIARYSLSADPNEADPASAKILLTVAQPFTNHNGGQLHFGPDGYLYIGIGDGGSGGDPQNNGQNLGTLLGKILRIDVDVVDDTREFYYIPNGNPFVSDAGAREEIWSFGLRNPWRFSFDRLTGDMFIGDVGQNSWEEVNFQPSTSTGGENYGWRLMEGNSCFNPATNCNNSTLTLPILVYNHSVGCSVTGGYRYRGSKNPNLYGLYLYGDYCTGLIWGAQENGLGGWNTTVLLDTNFSISTFGEDESGEIYFAHLSATNGAIYQVVQSTASTNSASVSSGGGGGGGAVGCFINTLVQGSQEVVGVWARFVLKLFSPFRNLTIQGNFPAADSGDI